LLNFLKNYFKFRKSVY